MVTDKTFSILLSMLLELRLDLIQNFMCVIDFAHDFIEYSHTLSSPKPSQMPAEVLSNGCLTFPQKSYLKKKI